MSLLRKNMLTLGIGALIIALTALVFLLLRSASAATDIWVISSALTCETISVCAVLIFNKVNTGSTRVMVTAGAYTAILLYLLVSLGLCAVLPLYRADAKVFLTAEAMLLALLLIVLILIFSYGKRLAKANDTATSHMTAMGVLESNVQLLRDHPANSIYSRQIIPIYEAIRNCDQSVHTVTDEILKKRVYDLHLLLHCPNPTHESVTELSDTILHLIQQRALEVRQAQKGGI